MSDNSPRQRSSYHNRNACSCYSFPLHTITSSISIVQPVLVPVLNSSLVPIHGDSSRTHEQTDGSCNAMQSERFLGQLNMMSDKSDQHDYVIFRVIIDSGCSSHTFNCLNYIDDYKVMIEEDQSTMTLADKTRVQIRGRGTCGILGQVYYVPEIRNCLLSVRQMDRQGVSTTFSEGVCEMTRRDTGKLVLTCKIQDNNGLYTLSQEQFEEQMGIGHQLCMAHSIRTDPASRLHYILNHASAARCNYECKCNKYPGLKYPLTEKMRDTIKKCVFCHMAKGRHRPNCQTMERHPIPGKSWSVDLKGPIGTPSLEYGNVYIGGFIDNNSRFVVKGFMKKKSDIYALTVFWVDTYITPLRKSNPELGKIFVHSDNGEFNSEKTQAFLLKHGIYSMLVCPYTPQHNGIIERVWQTLMSATVALLLTAGLGEEYWQEAFGCAVHVYNRMTCAHPTKYPKSPFEAFMEFKPIVGHFQPWGVIAFALNHNKSKKNLLERAELCLHMGYLGRHQVGYRLLALQTNEFIITNNATFVLSSEILVKDLFGTELTDTRQEELYQQLCKSTTSVLVNSGEKSYIKLGVGEGTRNVITRYPMRNLMKPTEKREPTITYSGMIPGEEPPYRPLLTEQIDIEQGLQELGQVS